MNCSRSRFSLAAIALSVLNTSAFGQQIGNNIPEIPPALPSETCTKAAGCVTEATSVVIDASRRIIDAADTKTLCWADGKWNNDVCSTPQECAKICHLEGAAYEANHSVTTSGDTLNMKLKTVSELSSRLYLLDASKKNYKLFHLLNREFTFDVDETMLPCGTNGALYFVKMDADGGKSRYPGNAAGAERGVGYCDAQCPKTIRFVNGEANFNNKTGSCCSEMDIWEANSMATSYAIHPCSTEGQQTCTTDEECGSTDKTQYTGLCDRAGCSFKPYRMGNKTFYGRGKEFDIDTTRPFTVITQFVTKDNTPTGELVEIRRLYKQDDRVVKNPVSTWPELKGIDSITDGMCSAYKKLFGEHEYPPGHLAQLGKQMIGGMVLVFSLWVDYSKHMAWLDSYETGKNPDEPGVRRGPCPNPGGDPPSVFAQNPDAGVKFMKIRTGEFGSTY